MTDAGVNSVDATARRSAVVAVMASILLGMVFVAFAWVSTQDHAVRAASPWQDDPYDAMVSFTEFAVPVVLVITAPRALLCRTNKPQPPFRIAQLLRAALCATTFVALTAATDLIGIAVGADRSAWASPTTPMLIGTLSALSIGTVLVLFLERTALKHIPRERLRDGDWLDDVGAVVALLTVGRVTLGSPQSNSGIAFIRRHAVAIAALASAAASAALTCAQAFGEGWRDPLVVIVFAAVSFGGFFGLAMLGNSVFVFATPTQAPSRTRRAATAAGTAAALGFPVMFAMRDVVMRLFSGVHGNSPLALFVVAACGAAVVGSVTFGVAMVRTNGARAR